MKTRGIVLAALLVGVGVAVALFFTLGGTPSRSARMPAGSSAAVDAASSSLGRILVDGGGRTLYLFGRDKTDVSQCSGACAALWPPYTTTSTPHAGNGVATGKLGTTTRSDGKIEVTYQGHPLYYYIGDGAPGQTNGEGLNKFGGVWHVLAPTGNKVEANSAGSASGY